MLDSNVCNISAREVVCVGGGCMCRWSFIWLVVCNVVVGVFIETYFCRTCHTHTLSLSRTHTHTLCLPTLYLSTHPRHTRLYSLSKRKRENTHSLNTHTHTLSLHSRHKTLHPIQEKARENVLNTHAHSLYLYTHSLHPL